MNELLFHIDVRGKSFLHESTQYGTPDIVKNIITVLPIETVTRLTVIKNKDGKTARDLAKNYLIRDSLDQAGSYPVEFYHLKTRPKVLIFYTTMNRLAQESADGESTDAVTEKDCVEQYFKEREFPCKTVEDPTANEIFSNITAAVIGGDLSGLLVFVMSHGEKGVVTVRGDPDFLTADQLMLHMCGGTEGKPKALIIQACQTKLTPAVDDSHQAAGCAEEPTSDEVTAAGAVGGCLGDTLGNRVDILAGGGTRHQALQEGVSLKQPDFLLYMATVSGAYALRHVMIPNFISSLRELRPSDCIITACQSANSKILAAIRKLDPHKTTGQLPKFEVTLQKKFCIGKRFSSS